MFNVNDLVTRKKYGNDIVFKIYKIENNTIFLKGLEIRLMADADEDDLKPYNKKKLMRNEVTNRNRDNNFFYLPGRILHIDSDNDYIEQCFNYYKSNNVTAKCINISEKDMAKTIDNTLIKNYEIIVITGHDAYYKNKKRGKDYLNSEHFIDTVKKIRASDSKIIVISGACQSDFESLIKSGSTYASSPKRINIHALDPAIVATELSLSLNTKYIDVENIISKTHYNKEGMGGIITKGTMKKGYPRRGEAN